MLQYPNELWERYFVDYSHHCLHLDAGTSSLSQRVIYAFFSDIHTLPPIERVVYIHTYVHYNKLSLANISSFLRPLEKIWEAAEDSPHSLTTDDRSQASCFIAAVRQTKYPFGDPQRLSEFVLSALFSTLVGSVYPRQTEDHTIDRTGHGKDLTLGF